MNSSNNVEIYREEWYKKLKTNCERMGSTELQGSSKLPFGRAIYLLLKENKELIKANIENKDGECLKKISSKQFSANNTTQNYSCWYDAGRNFFLVKGLIIYKEDKQGKFILTKRGYDFIMNPECGWGLFNLLDKSFFELEFTSCPSPYTTTLPSISKFSKLDQTSLKFCNG